MIFGTGKFAEVAHYLFTEDSAFEVVAFTVSEGAMTSTEFRGLPVVPYESLEGAYPPDRCGLFTAVGYRDLNRARAAIYRDAKERGYSMATYVSSKATVWTPDIGDNCFVFEDNTVQPFARIGSDVVLWSGNHIGHHTTIGDHCFITSHVVVSGNVRVGEYTFIGVNATVRDGISIGCFCIIGAGALIMRSTRDKEVYAPPATRPDTRTSDDVTL